MIKITSYSQRNQVNYFKYISHIKWFQSIYITHPFFQSTQQKLPYNKALNNNKPEREYLLLY